MKKYIPFCGIMMIAFVAFLDYMVINNALPAIQGVFHVSILNLQWLANVYSITLATTMILFGRLGDIFGSRRIFYSGALLLVVGSLGAGLSHQFESLIFFRLIQSFGISAIIVIAPSIIQFMFQDSAHMPMSLYSTIGGLGLLLGPYIGGVILTHFGWQWIFLINIPLLVLALLICLPFVPAFNEHSHSAKIDWLGNVLLIVSLVSLIYALVRQQQVGLDFVTLASWLIFIVSMPLLVYIEKRHLAPILNFNFFKKSDFTVAVLSNAMSGALVSCGMFFSPLFLQQNMDLSPAAAGTVLLSFAIGIVIFSPLIGPLGKKIGSKKTMMLGLATGLVGAIAYILFFVYANLIIGIVAFCLTGLSLAVNNTVSTLSAIKGVGQKNAGAAVGTIFSVFNMTAAAMLAITSVLWHVLTHSGEFNLAAKSAYAWVFVLVAAYALVLFLGGLKMLRARTS